MSLDDAIQAVVAEAVLAHPLEPRRVDVDRHRGLSVLVAHPVDVARAALSRASGEKKNTRHTPTSSSMAAGE